MQTKSSRKAIYSSKAQREARGSNQFTKVPKNFHLTKHAKIEQ